MLLEITNVKQYPNKGLRRCFRSADFNLLVWTRYEQAIAGFEIGYALGCNEGTLSKLPGKAVDHHGVDNGDSLLQGYNDADTHPWEGAGCGSRFGGVRQKMRLLAGHRPA